MKQNIDKYVQDIRTQFEELNRQVDKNANIGVAIEAITAPFLPPLVRRHFAHSIPNTGILLEAYRIMQDLNKKLTTENEQLKAELNKSKNSFNPFNLHFGMEDDDCDCANCPDKHTCLTYATTKSDSCEDDETEGTSLVTVVWMDGSTVSFSSTSIKQIADEALMIDLDEGGSVVIPMNKVRFYSFQ